MKKGDERFQRLHRWICSPLLEPALMFQTNAILIFTNFNLLLERDEPSTHVLKAAMESLGWKLASRIVTPTHLCYSTPAFDLDLHDDQLYKEHTSIFLGMTMMVQSVIIVITSFMKQCITTSKNLYLTYRKRFLLVVIWFVIQFALTLINVRKCHGIM